jgi:hypothetical protein
MVWLRLRSRHGEKAPGLIGNVAELDQTAAFADDVEQIAMFCAGGIRPSPGSTFAGFRSYQPDKERATGCVSDVANQPVPTFAAPVGKIMTAHRLGIARETVRQFGGWPNHGHAAARPAMRASG